MSISYTLDLDQFFPKDIIGLHQNGVITLEEILASDWNHREFGDLLQNYVYNQLKLQAKKLDAELGDTVAS